MSDNGQRLLEVNHLRTSFFTGKGEVRAVNDVSYYVDSGEVIAVVGESGCGKSVTQMSVLQLVSSPPGKILGGEILFKGENLLNYEPKSKEIRAIRGSKIAMIFQEPMTSLNPIIKVGKQLTDIIMTHRKLSKKDAWQVGTDALAQVGIPDPAERMNQYPFEMSGGMRQRVLIAMAVACDSEMIIADEPTTALDVTTQAQVMELLVDLVHERHLSLVVVTHNLGLVTRYADRIYVMYAGRIIESGSCKDIMDNPRHPYTRGLLRAVPRIDGSKSDDLIPIEGAPPDLSELKEECSFLPRCTFAKEQCRCQKVPELIDIGDNAHKAACFRALDEE